MSRFSKKMSWAGGVMLCKQFRCLSSKHPRHRFPNDRSSDLHKLAGTEERLPRIMLSAEPFSTAEWKSPGFDLNLKVATNAAGETNAAGDKRGLIVHTAGKPLGWSGHGNDFSGPHLGWQETGECSAVLKNSPGFSIRFPANSSL